MFDLGAPLARPGHAGVFSRGRLFFEAGIGEAVDVSGRLRKGERRPAHDTGQLAVGADAPECGEHRRIAHERSRRDELLEQQQRPVVVARDQLVALVETAEFGREERAGDAQADGGRIRMLAQIFQDVGDRDLRRPGTGITGLPMADRVLVRELRDSFPILHGQNSLAKGARP